MQLRHAEAGERKEKKNAMTTQDAQKAAESEQWLGGCVEIESGVGRS